MESSKGNVFVHVDGWQNEKEKEKTAALMQANKEMQQTNFHIHIE